MKKLEAIFLWRHQIIVLIFLWSSTPTWAQEIKLAKELARQNQCLGCHADDKKVIGPSFKSIANRYTNSKETHLYLTNKIRNGGAGVWGVVPMPANKNNITDNEIQVIIQWIFSLQEEKNKNNF